MTAIEFPPMQKGASFNLDCGEGKDRSGQSGDRQVDTQIWRAAAGSSGAACWPTLI